VTCIGNKLQGKTILIPEVMSDGIVFLCYFGRSFLLLLVWFATVVGVFRLDFANDY